MKKLNIKRDFKVYLLAAYSLQLNSPFNKNLLNDFPEVMILKFQYCENITAWKNDSTDNRDDTIKNVFTGVFGDT